MSTGVRVAAALYILEEMYEAYHHASRCRRHLPSITISLPPNVRAKVELVLGIHCIRIITSFVREISREISSSTSICAEMDANLVLLQTRNLRKPSRLQMRKQTIKRPTQSRHAPEGVRSATASTFKYGNSKSVERLCNNYSAHPHQFRFRAPCHAQKTPVQVTLGYPISTHRQTLMPNKLFTNNSNSHFKKKLQSSFRKCKTS